MLVSIIKGLVTLIRQGLSNLGAILAGIFRNAVNAGAKAFAQIVIKVRNEAGLGVCADIFGLTSAT